MIPLNIISGFLGAGKTTFIKRLLDVCQQRNERIVLIENEFGTIGIDGELVRRDGLEVFEITKGCICCSMKEDFAVTLSTILDRIRPDRILFEPSGIFVFDEIRDMLKSPAFSSRCRVESMITIVDCIHFLKQQHKYGPFFQNQISHADAVVLSKVQLTSEKVVLQVAGELVRINDHAEILMENWDFLSDVTLAALMDRKHEEASPEMHDKGCSHHCSNPEHSHASTAHQHFDTTGFATYRIFTEQELESLLDNLVHQGEILRAKGLLCSKDSGLEFSYVNGSYTILHTASRPAGIISFIGQRLPRRELHQLFS
jgi:G3E family GTPase